MDFTPGYFWRWRKAGSPDPSKALQHTSSAVGFLRLGVTLRFKLQIFLSAHAHTSHKKMDLNFYSDLTDGTGQPGDPEFLDAQAFNGFDTVQKVISVIL